MNAIFTEAHAWVHLSLGGRLWGPTERVRQGRSGQPVGMAAFFFSMISLEYRSR